MWWRMRHAITSAGRGAADVTIEQPEPIRAPGSWLRERAWLLDLLVALAVWAYNLPTLPVYSSDPARLAALMAVSAGLCGSYLFRRRCPLAVLAVMLAVACVHPLLGAPIIAADVMLLPALYNVAARYQWRLSLTAAVAIVLWLLVTVLPRLSEVFLNIGEFGLLVVLVAWVWTWGTLVRIRRDYVASLQERTRQLERERQAQAQIAAAAERARIAREIHDIVAHSLSVVVVLSDGAAATVETEPARARSAMLTVAGTSRSALAEMRRMLGVLREDEPGSHAPQPGIGQVGQLVEESQEAGLPVDLRVEGEPVPLSAGLDLTVYRVVQEALTNVRKHAGPAVGKVEVSLHWRNTDLDVRVTDDGQGFRGDRDGETAGHGLVGMQERVAAYGGTLRAGMRPSGGFEVRAVLPTGDGQ